MHYYKIIGAPTGLKYKECRSCISVGAQAFEGERLQALIDWMNIQQTFDKFQIVLADTLQRHNVPEKLISPDAAEQQARVQGDLWLQRHAGLLQTLKIPIQLWRWDDFRLSEIFPISLKKLLSLMESDKDFSTTLETDVKQFIERKQRNHTDHLITTDGCRNYFLEELACISIMIKQLPMPEIYPSRCFQTARYLQIHGKRCGFPEFIDHSFLELKSTSRLPPFDISSDALVTNPLTVEHRIEEGKNNLEREVGLQKGSKSKEIPR